MDGPTAPPFFAKNLPCGKACGSVAVTMGLFDFLSGKKTSTSTSSSGTSEPASAGVDASPMAASTLGDLAAKLPFPVRSVRTAAAEAELLRLREQLAADSKVPVLLGSKDDVQRLVESWTYEELDFPKELARSREMTPEEWFASRVADDPECYESLEDVGEFPSKAAPNTMLQGASNSGIRVREVFIAEIPTAEAWQVPLHLRCGGWNANPFPYEHALMARYWQEKYGALIATVANDVMEYTVAKPPQTDAEALDLARQQYVYCNDIVDQGTESIAALAASLKNSRRWFFWWD